MPNTAPNQAVHERAFVLNRRPYRETSLLLEAFSAERGRVGLVARGARRGKSPLAGLLQPFYPLLLSWRGSGDLFTLTQAEADGVLKQPGNLGVKSGFYVNELLLRLLHRHDAHPELFESYRQVLTQLITPGGEERALRIFEKRLLAAIGYGLPLDRAVDSGRALEQGKRYLYRPNQGFFEGGFFEGQQTLEPGPDISGEALIHLANESLSDPEELREAKQLMRVVLREHLGEKPLASRMLFRHMT